VPDKVRIHGNIIQVGDHTWVVPHPIRDARLLDDKVVVIFEYTAGPPDQQFKNLVAYDLKGDVAWVAEHPGTSVADVYVDFLSTDPLRVGTSRASTASSIRIPDSW
jgi:hypothetical protein